MYVPARLGDVNIAGGRNVDWLAQNSVKVCFVEAGFYLRKDDNLGVLRTSGLEVSDHLSVVEVVISRRSFDHCSLVGDLGSGTLRFL